MNGETFKGEIKIGRQKRWIHFVDDVLKIKFMVLSYISAEWSLTIWFCALLLIAYRRWWRWWWCCFFESEVNHLVSSLGRRRHQWWYLIISAPTLTPHLKQSRKPQPQRKFRNHSTPLRSQYIPSNTAETNVVVVIAESSGCLVKSFDVYWPLLR